MPGIIVALPKLPDAKTIKNLLVQNGFSEIVAVSSGAQAISNADYMEMGLVISGYKLPDMIYSQLAEDLPADFKLLLLASGRVLAERSDEDIVSLQMPFQVHDLLGTVELMMGGLTLERRKKKAAPKKRSPQEETLINEAKALLMSRNNMSEKEAHRYIQKRSMDASTSFVEMAQMILAMR